MAISSAITPVFHNLVAGGSQILNQNFRIISIFNADTNNEAVLELNNGATALSIPPGQWLNLPEASGYEFYQVSGISAGATGQLYFYGYI